MRVLLVRVLLVLVLALAATGPVRAQPLKETISPAPARLVLLWAPCSVSKSYLSPYAVGVPYTPNFGRLAAEGVTFEAHRTEAGSSGIAYAALFSGSQVDRHGVAAHPAALPDELYLLPEAFSDAGWRSQYWNKHGMASAALNYAQGIRKGGVVRETLDGRSPRFRALLASLRTFPKLRVFVMANLTTTHGPYQTSALTDFFARFPGEQGKLSPKRRSAMTRLYWNNHLSLAYNFPDVLAGLSLTPADVPALADTIEPLYASNIWRLDTQLGGVLDAIDEFGLRDASIVAVTADHGEVMYREHEVFPWTHSSSLAPEVIEVPLIIRAPGVAAGRYASVTRSIDVYPTLLGLAGIPAAAPRGVQGTDLSGVLYGRESPPELTAYSHTGGLAKPVVKRMREPDAKKTWGQRMKQYPTGDFRHSSAALRRGDLVVRLMSIDGESFELVAYDHASDPYEAVNVFDPRNPAHAEAARDLRSYKDRLEMSVGASRRKASKRDPSEAKMEETLRALGYIE